MISGSVSGSLSGDYRDAVLQLRAVALRAGIFFVLVPFDLARGRYFAIWINGVWTGRNYYVGLTGFASDLIPCDTSEDCSIFVMEVGQCDSFPDGPPDDFPQYLDAMSAARIVMRWTAGIEETVIDGDGQLLGISVSGARRGVNVGEVPSFPTRGRLYYTILNVGGTYFVRWFSGLRLVAEGSRAGDGALVCADVNEGNLAIACTLAYVADVILGEAWLDVLWPGAFAIHYLKQDETLNVVIDGDQVTIDGDDVIISP